MNEGSKVTETMRDVHGRAPFSQALRVRARAAQTQLELLRRQLVAEGGFERITLVELYEAEGLCDQLARGTSINGTRAKR